MHRTDTILLAAHDLSARRVVHDHLAAAGLPVVDAHPETVAAHARSVRPRAIVLTVDRLDAAVERQLWLLKADPLLWPIPIVTVLTAAEKYPPQAPAAGDAAISAPFDAAALHAALAP